MIENIKRDNLINGQYQIQKEIGHGSHGKVYEACTVAHHYPVAVKLNSNNQLLNREVKIYNYIWNYKKKGKSESLNIPEMLWDGEYGNMRAMVMSRLGPSLDKLFDRYSKKWSLATVCRIATDCLLLLKEVHKLGLVHRDIKPDNFAVDNSEGTGIYIFDFGLSSQYISPSGKHIPVRDGLSLIGTMRYASIHVHEGFLQSRRDDLESFFYMLLYFTTGSLPWKKINEEVIPDRGLRSLAILKLKKELSEINLPEILYPFFKAIRNLNYSDTFDYDEWILYFGKLACSRNETDWHIQSNMNIPRQKHTLRNHTQ